MCFAVDAECPYKCDTCDSDGNCTGLECAGNRISSPNCSCPSGHYDDGNPDCP